MKNFILGFLAILMMAVPSNDVSAEATSETILLSNDVGIEAPSDVILPFVEFGTESVFPVVGDYNHVPDGRIFSFLKDFVFYGDSSGLQNVPQVSYLKHRFAEEIPIVFERGSTINMFKRLDGCTYMQYGKCENSGKNCPNVQGLEIGVITLVIDLPLSVIQGDDAIATITDGNGCWSFYKVGESTN